MLRKLRTESMSVKAHHTLEVVATRAGTLAPNRNPIPTNARCER